MKILCAECGAVAETRSAAMKFCSPNCRIRNIGKSFDATSGCWDWPLSRNVQTGYGQLSTWVDGKQRILTAHRASYEAFTGAIPSDRLVMHSCDNRACFNPAHLSLGTQKDNMSDASAKGRTRGPPKPLVSWQKRHPDRVPKGSAHFLKQRGSGCLPRGERNHNAKLSEAAVRQIRASDATGVVLAKRFGVTGALISAVLKRKIWKHVT